MFLTLGEACPASGLLSVGRFWFSLLRSKGANQLTVYGWGAFGWAKQLFFCWRALPQGAGCPHTYWLASVPAGPARQQPVEGSTQISLAGPLSPSLGADFVLGSMLEMGMSADPEAVSGKGFLSPGSSSTGDSLSVKLPCKLPCLCACISPQGILALQGCNQASNQLGKLTAGVSYFLFMTTSLGYVNPLFPRSPDPPHLGVFSDA